MIFSKGNTLTQLYHIIFATLNNEKTNNNDQTISSIQMNSVFQRLFNKISKSFSKQRDEEKPSSSSYDIQKIYCRFCGKANPASSEHCSQCKKPITIPPSKVLKVCEKCGLAVNDDSVYCYNCGTVFFNGT
jgi:hypothetical protein